MKILRKKVQMWLWRQFLRIGHDLVWKADEWFQQQEVNLRKVSAHMECASKNDESIDGEHEQDGRSERDEFPNLGRADGERHRLRGASESAGAGGHKPEAGIRLRTDGGIAGYGRGDEGRVRAVRNHDGSPRRLRRQTGERTRIGAAEFDKRIVVKRTAFTGMVLAKSQSEG